MGKRRRALVRRILTWFFRALVDLFEPKDDEDEGG